MNQNLGTFDTISLKYLLSGIKIRLGIRDNTTQDMLIKDLIVEAVKRMRLPNIFVKATAYLPIDNYRAQLPKGWVRFVGENPVVLVDDSGEESLNTFFPVFVNDTFFKNDPSKAVQSTSIVTVNVVDGWLIFSSNCSLSRCEIAYLSADYTCSGDLCIKQDMETPIIAFVMWQYGLMNSDKMPQWVCINWERQYKLNKKAVKGIENIPSSLENALIKYTMNSII